MNKEAKRRLMGRIKDEFIKRWKTPTVASKIFTNPEKADTPFMLYPVKWLGGKRGKAAVDKISLGITRGSEIADEKMGRMLIGGKGEKPKGFLKSMFTEKKYVPISPGSKTYEKVYVPKVSAPLKKTVAFASPMIVADQISEKLNKPKLKKDNPMGNKVLVDKNLIHKTASAIEKVGEERDGLRKQVTDLEKTASMRKQAEELAFKMVNRGVWPQFNDYEEFQEKVASLMDQDLDVASKALEYQDNIADLGTISNVRSRGGNAIESFVLE